MIDPVAVQYEAYPYPERNPADEAKRLLYGSPSHPVEIDHFIFGGARDWSKPFRALVAGGGTGDAAIMLGQMMADAKVEAEIVYLDMSAASRRIAEARAAARGLSNIRFETGDLTRAPEYGVFDYVDCCGVLHHLPEPDLGFQAISDALAEDGGCGIMVYAPHGRTGVYQMQAALHALTAGMAPEAQVAQARAVLAAAPETNWLLKNDIVQDHKQNDAGLYDLLLHARDRPYRAGECIAAVERAGLVFQSFTHPALYEPETWIGDAASPAKGLDPATRAELAENLAGNMKKHAFYATKPGAKGAAKAGPARRPVLAGVQSRPLALEIARKGELKLTMEEHRHVIPIAREAAPLISYLNGAHTLGEIAARMKTDWLGFAAAYGPVERALTGINALHYSDRFRSPD